MQNIYIRKATNSDAPYISDLIFNIWINEYHFAVQRENFPFFYEDDLFMLKDEWQ